MHHFIVAGVKFHQKAFTEANVKLGDKIELKPEPTNLYDSNAIAVYKGEHHIGYVPRTNNVEILKLITTGPVACLVETAWPRGCGVSVESQDESTRQTTPVPHDE